MLRRHFIFSAMGAVIAGCAPHSGQLPGGTQLIVFRHADRAGDFLNSKGQARSVALVAALEGVPIDAIYAPDIGRNLETAAPLAKARGMKVTVIPKEFLLATINAEAAGKSVIWIGNKDNIQHTWTALGASGPAPLEYGDLAILQPGPLGGVKVTRQRVEI